MTERQGEEITQSPNPPVSVSPGHLVSVSSKHKTLPYLALLVGVTAMGMSAIFVKWANAPGAVTGFYRMLIAIAVFALPVGLRAKREGPLSLRHVWFAMLGGIFFALDLSIWNTSVTMTSAANSTLFGNTSVIWVAIGALVVFKEKLRPIFWVGLIIALIGMLIVLGQDFITHPTLGMGDILAIVAGLWYGLFFLAAERSRDKLSSFTAWWVSSATSTVALWVICLVFGMPLFGYSPETYWNFFAIAIVVQVVSLLCVNYALGHLPASIVSPTLLGQPVTTAIFAIPLLGQWLSVAQIIGGLLVMVGILIVHWSKTR